MVRESLRNFLDAFLAAVSLKFYSEVVVGTMSQYLPKILYSLLTNTGVIYIGDHGSGWRWFPVAISISKITPIL